MMRRIVWLGGIAVAATLAGLSALSAHEAGRTRGGPMMGPGMMQAGPMMGQMSEMMEMCRKMMQSMFKQQGTPPAPVSEPESPSR